VVLGRFDLEGGEAEGEKSSLPIVAKCIEV
jgi:hypothetical protein